VTTVPFAGELLADIYQPSGDPAKCRVGVVWVHGGGFTQAARNGPAEQAWGTALAARGYVLVSVDYRLGSGEPFGLDQATDPVRIAIVNNAIADAITAITWLRAASPQWGVDPNRIVIGGTSAGAMTALGAAMTSPAADRPCAVVSVSGDLDPAWVGSNPVPALLIHGDSDMLVPYQSSVDAVQRLTDAGGQAQLVTVNGAGHEITGVPTPDMIDVVARWLRESVATGCS
jgi:acetyl esterase/lipase